MSIEIPRLYLAEPVKLPMPVTRTGHREEPADGYSPALHDHPAAHTLHKTEPAASGRDLGALAERLENAVTGKPLWSFKPGSTPVAQLVLTPAGKVLFQDQEHVTCLDAGSGTKSWELARTPGHTISFSGAADGTAYLSHQVPGFLTAVDDRGGEKWRYALQPGVYLCSDMTPSAVNGALFARTIREDGKKRDIDIISVDSATGTEKWRKTFPEGGIFGGLAMSPDESICFVDMATTSHTAGRPDRLAALDGATGKTLWTKDVMVSSNTLAAGPHGALYYMDPGQKLHCLDGASGKEKWAFGREAESTFQRYHMAPDGTIYYFSPHMVAALDGESGAPLWEHALPHDRYSAVGVDSNGTMVMADYSSTPPKLQLLDAATGTPSDASPIRNYSQDSARTIENGILYHIDKDRAICASMLTYTVEQIAGEEGGASGDTAQPETVENENGYIIIGGVRMPVAGGDMEGAAS